MTRDGHKKGLFTQRRRGSRVKGPLLADEGRETPHVVQHARVVWSDSSRLFIGVLSAMHGSFPVM